MTLLIIIIVLIVCWPYIWRLLAPYFVRWMQRRTERYVRNAMGMPPRDEKKSSRRRQSSQTARRRYRRRSHEPVIPKEYAEDVEFTEIHSFSEERKIADAGEVSYVEESQVSDAEIIEIEKN